MSEEVTKNSTGRSNPDYTASAVGLGNHEPVIKILSEYHEVALKVDALTSQIDDFLKDNPIYKELAEANIKLKDKKKAVIERIDQFGSYQDTEMGMYAVKQAKVSKSYLAEPFATHYEKYAPAVIEKSINVKALEGLIKGKLIKEEELEQAGVTIKDTKYTYIVK